MILAALAFTIASNTFKPNATVPVKMVCTDMGGANVSPQLQWSGAPKGTRSFALIVHDPDAPHLGGWYHWVVYDIPPSTTTFAEHASLPQSELGTTSGGDLGYAGMCPPPGKVHHYNFTLYALDVPSISGARLTGPQLEQALAGHVLAKTSVTGLYQTK
jgi:Raf kinase inhibitor-like YbhB/YbcL family protein